MSGIDFIMQEENIRLTMWAFGLVWVKKQGYKQSKKVQL